MTKIIILFFITINCQAQMVAHVDIEIPDNNDLHPCLFQVITVGSDDESVEDVLDKISNASKKTCYVPVCYVLSSKTKKRLKFDTQPRTLIETVNLALQDTGLSFKIMGEHQIVVYGKITGVN
jgi:hypothetical protein